MESSLIKSAVTIMLESVYLAVDDDDRGEDINAMYYTPFDINLWPEHLFIKESAAVSKIKTYCASQIHLAIKSNQRVLYKKKNDEVGKQEIRKQDFWKQEL